MNLPEEAQIFRKEARRMLNGGEPNGVGLADVGPYADHLSAMHQAFALGGTPRVRQVVAALTHPSAPDGNQLAALIAGDPEPEAPQKKILHFSQLRALPPLQWLIKGEISANSFTVVFAPSGVGKSALSIHYGLTIAQTHNIVYIAAEGAGGYAARAQVWCDYHKKSMGGAYLYPEAVNMLEGGEVAAFIKEIEPLSPALVVVDTLARCMVGGDENSAKDMGLFVAGCDEIKRATGATILVNHHTGVAGTRERGSTALRGAADVMIELVNDDGLITVRCEKSKDARPFESRYLRLVVRETGRKLEDGEPETSCVLVPASRVNTSGTLTASKRKILEALNLETFRAVGAPASKLISITGIKDSTFYRIASDLLRDGFVRQATKGDPYYITESGEIAITPTTPTGLS